ncbi:uncharacterized protein LOC113209003 isoform X3 [Frankliniella occidentalis]|uniref:Uncharacterized protein LOC113209003 isoform X3 n=1 Tax=Frankliniella occidentalis TaxID=133901 RepID=A0A6J1SMW3_FRAOC|nr:uncharacterized protein LOC113209003 isoform X3 [Frankliniella occidentalis]
MDLDCEVCLEELNQTGRVPKVVPCGHTVCLQCLQCLPRPTRCPSCRAAFTVAPESLPNNFSLLRVMDRRGDSSSWAARHWCLDCRAAAKRRCWEEHEMVGTRTALRRLLEGTLPLASRQLEGLPGVLQEEQTLLALTLMAGDEWEVTLRGTGRVVSATLHNSEDPLTKTLWLLLAARAAIAEQDQQAPAARPGPASSPSPPRHHGPVPKEPSPSTTARRVGTQPPRATRPVDPPVMHDMLPAPPHHHIFDGFLQYEHATPPTGTTTSRRELNVASLCCTERNSRQQEKAAALLEVRGVRRLVGVVGSSCWDPDWSLQLLESAAPTVEELHVSHPSEAHLAAVLAMPRLRRLQVWCAPDAFGSRPPALPAAAPGPGLRWLTAVGLPLATLHALLKSHGRALEVLQLLVGTRGPGQWPMACGPSGVHLADVLVHADLRALWRLVLRRKDCCHERAACAEQLGLARFVLPRADVLCETCDHEELERF